ncbi:MAG: bifunctional aspartate kinase/homoserine dehydrogenase I [Bacteroidia bacterium]|nr:bifunctional aspartate kinase/homoserine dehydrogenase I [Bacteroidia bacterium]
MKVLKFGGSSVANAERIDRVARIIQEYVHRGEKIAVVVSAMGGATDILIKMSKIAASGSTDYKELLEQFSARHREVVNSLVTRTDLHEPVYEELVEGQIELSNLLQGLYLTRDLTPRTLDYIQSFGERSSAFMIAQVLNNYGTPARYVNARELIITNDNYGSAKIFAQETGDNIRAHFHNYPDEVSVVTGFIASTREGITTTLGRGGSDYTASLVGSAMGVEEIQIWTDVDGVMTADPRRVSQSFPVRSMSYEEALEMSHFGARVIYPPTIIPALEKKIPIRIKNTFNPSDEGTLISDHPEPYTHTVKGISSISDISLITLEGSGLFGASGFAARLFNVLSNKQINAILITQGSSEHSISFAIRPEDAELARRGIEEEFALEMSAKLIAPVKMNHGLAVIAVIGDNMKSRPGISGKFFTALGKNGVNVIVTAQGSSERNISVVINREDESKALTAVHDVFFLSDYYVLNIFVVGVGLIGSTLLEQIRLQSEFLRTEQFVQIRVVGLSNSKKMVFDADGIDLDTWKDTLDNSEETADLGEFVERMKKMNLANCVFVDNTAEESIRHYYADILRNAISISTPNKVAVSAEFENYQLLKRVAEEHSVKFFYETNVGAGLPILTTLSDLVNSGDRILKIEGVLSGSLSFIFNNFTEGKRFSDIVKQAREKGFTEPDPRIDLSGKDVARKLLILARESRKAMEMDHLEIENILPQPCIEAPTVEAFLDQLEKHDDVFEGMRIKAATAGKVLRFIATLEGDRAFISLQELGPDSPFYQLNGSDNMIVFTTTRYHERPLVIKGPGAGAEVTAAGVFAEILRIGYYLS